MKKKKLLTVSFIISLIIILILIVILVCTNKKEKITPNEEEIKTTELNAIEKVSISKIDKYVSKESAASDETIYLVKDGAMLTLRNSSLSKLSGNSTNIESTKYIGLNSSFIVAYNSIGKIYNSTITTEAEGSPAIYGSGKKSEIIIENSTIETYDHLSSTIISNNNSVITGNNLIINTKAKSSPALETISNDSYIKISDSSIETNGSGSPIIKGHGQIELNNTTGIANGSRIAILEKDAEIKLNQVTSIVSGGSNEENYSESAILIYSNNITDRATFTAINSSLNINQSLPYYNSAPLFIVDNISATINLNNTPLNFGSNKLMTINNSNITLNLNNEVIEGDIISSSSNITINLKDKSSLSGILPNNTKIFLSEDSSLILKDNTYLSSLNNEDETNSNIIFNGYKLYINNKEIEE